MEYINWEIVKDKLYAKILNQISTEDLNNWLNENIEPETFMGIVKQYATAQNFTNNFERDIFDFQTDVSKNDDAIIFMTYDINLMFSILLPISGINIDKKDFTTANYDLIIKSGFYEFLMGKMYKTFDEIKRKCDIMTGINELPMILTIQNTYSKPISPESMAKITEEINKIDKDKLQIIEAVQNFNNPTVGKIAKILSKESMMEFVNKDTSTSDTSKKRGVKDGINTTKRVKKTEGENKQDI